MHYCKNDPKKTYKGDEPSPKGFGYCAHSENIGTIRSGKDGNKWIISSTSKGIKRWTKYETKKKSEKSIKNNSSIKLYSEEECLKEKWWDDSKKKLSKNNPIFKNIKHTGYKIYFPYDNSGTPYAVYIKNKNNPIYIYCIPSNDNDMYFEENEYDWRDRHKNAWAYIQLVVKIIPQEIFIGKSEKLPLSKYYNMYSYNKEDDGNSILVKIGSNKYVYIGTEIYTFTSKNKIIKYVSMASTSSNNIFPFASDIDNNYYLLQYNVFINKNNLNFLNNNDFYGNLEVYYFDNPDKFTKVDDYELITSSFL